MNKTKTSTTIHSLNTFLNGGFIENEINTIYGSSFTLQYWYEYFKETKKYNTKKNITEAKEIQNKTVILYNNINNVPIQLLKENNKTIILLLPNINTNITYKSELIIQSKQEYKNNNIQTKLILKKDTKNGTNNKQITNITYKPKPTIQQIKEL